MEWTEEKIEKIYQELRRSYRYSPFRWRKYLISLGVEFKDYDSYGRGDSNEWFEYHDVNGFLVLRNPCERMHFLKIPEDIAEKILVLGL
jgi:hypothetical protein